MTIVHSLSIALLFSTVLTIQAKSTYEFGRPIEKRVSNLRRNRAHDNNRRQLVHKLVSDTIVGNGGDALNEVEFFIPLRMAAMSVSYSYSYTYGGTHYEIGDIESSIVEDETRVTDINHSSDNTLVSSDGKPNLGAENTAGNDVGGMKSEDQATVVGSVDLPNGSADQLTVTSSFVSAVPRTGDNIAEVEDQTSFGGSRGPAMIGIVVGAGMGLVVSSAVVAIYVIWRRNQRNGDNVV